jgi:hypothetical protein
MIAALSAAAGIPTPARSPAATEIDGAQSIARDNTRRGPAGLPPTLSSV